MNRMTGSWGVKLWVFASSLAISSWACAELKGTVLWYMEEEPGIDAYKVRYIVTQEFLRSDEGDDKGSFVLLDRKQGQIYSVVRENRTIMHIDGTGDRPVAPKNLSIDIREAVDNKAPKVGGKSPLSVELFADNELCYSAVIVPGFLDEVRAAFQEFAQLLAVQQARTLDNTPKEYQTPCFLSEYLYATDFHLQRGFPLADWSAEGDRRELIAYESDIELDAGLFSLPGEFRIIRASGH